MTDRVQGNFSDHGFFENSILKGDVTQERLEGWMDVMLTLAECFSGVFQCGIDFQFGMSDESVRHRENAIAQKLCSFAKGIYSISVWDVKSWQDRAISLCVEDFLREDEVGRLQKTELESLGRTKMVIVERMRD